MSELSSQNSETHQRPATSREKEEFSSGGRRSLLILRGPTGLAIDKAIVWSTGWSLAHSREIRSACLPFFGVGNDMVLRGSNGGGPTDPHWVHNVRADPHAWVRIRRKNRPVHAHVAKGEERERIYQNLCQQSRSTDGYQKMCHPRELPLVVLRDWKRIEDEG